MLNLVLYLTIAPDTLKHGLSVERGQGSCVPNLTVFTDPNKAIKTNVDFQFKQTHSCLVNNFNDKITMDIIIYSNLSPMNLHKSQQNGKRFILRNGYQMQICMMD